MSIMRIILASDGLYYVMSGGYEFGPWDTYNQASAWIREQMEWWS